MKKVFLQTAFVALACGGAVTLPVQAQVTLLAKGTLTSSAAGSYRDLSGLNDTLENGAPANLLGGLGSGIAYVSGDTFLAVPDRGPNAISFNPLVDDTVSWIPRVQTVRMNLEENRGSGLPYTITPKLVATTLLSSPTPLVYGTGNGLNIGSGKPKENSLLRYYLSGRSDNFDADRNSGDPKDARLDPESIRLSNDGLTYFISDEYGPYVYQFLRATGTRIRTYQMPEDFYVAHPAPTTDLETSLNSVGRIANKGMEGLAITPDGRKLIGILQTATLQDTAEGGDAANLLRMAEVDVLTGKVLHEYGYLLTTGSGVSDLVALNDHELLVDERDGKGLGDGSKAKVKQVFKIDLQGATDILGMDGTQAAKVAVNKTLFLDVVKVLEGNGFTAEQIPAKIEGLAFGPDVKEKGKVIHTLWVANDNDFLQDYNGVVGSNPNQFFVFGFTDKDLAGSKFVPQAKGDGGLFGQGGLFGNGGLF
ncbi:MAG TPA: esterase-like activity of phytase family protein [Edaphobacter sp.]|nr:esterase-like activity of phytase family protein [Edaphobacter sp.]